MPPKQQPRESDWRCRDTVRRGCPDRRTRNRRRARTPKSGRPGRRRGPVDPHRDVATWPGHGLSRTSATGSGWAAARTGPGSRPWPCAPVMVWTGGKPASSPSISGAICGSSFTRTARCADRRRTQRPQRLQRRRNPLRAVLDVAPDAHRGHAHRGGQPLIEHHAIHRTAHRHRGDRLARASDGAATQPNPSNDSSRSNATPWARTLANSAASWSWWKSSTWSCGPADRRSVGRASGRSTPGSPCRPRCSARADGRRPGSGSLPGPVADLLQVDDVGSVQNREVHDKPGGAVQFAQQRAAARTRRSWCTASEPSSTSRMPSS